MNVAMYLGAHQLDKLASPVVNQELSDFRLALGYNDVSEARNAMYLRNYRSADRRPYSPSRMPIFPSVEQLVRLWNTFPWHLTATDPDQATVFWRYLRNNLKWHGIDLTLNDLPGVNAAEPGDIPPEAKMWQRYLSMSGHGAPLAEIIRDYYRSLPRPAAEQAVNERELLFSMQRHELRRLEDRERFLKPYFNWSPDQISRLRYMGVISESEHRNLRSSIGIVREEDVKIRDRLEQIIPDPGTLIKWANRYLWDAETLQTFGLDDGYLESPIANFFAHAQGMGRANDPLPDQPEGETNWLKLAMRASKKLPSFSECRHLQWRLRNHISDRGENIPPEGGVWNYGHTRMCLQTEGLPDKVIEKMLSVISEPMPLHMLAVVITPLLEHANIRDIVEQQYGVRQNWLYETLRDHGLDEKAATVADAAIRQEALDKKNADMIAQKKRIKAESRAAYLEAYRMGTEDANTVMRHITGEQYTDQMATDEFAVIDLDITNNIAKMKLEALKQAFMSGQKNEQETRRGFGILEFAENRINQYLEIWNWERTVNHRQLTTAEIMQGLKAGIVQPAQALQRMANLGWNNADALVEIQLVQHELAVAQAKAVATAQAHAKQEAVQLTRAQQIAAAKARAAAAKAAAIAAKVTKEQALAVHQKLMAESEYYAKVHTSNDAYAAAEKKGDDEKMLAELLKQQAAYQEWLIRQIELASEGIGVQHEIGPIQTAQAPGPHSSPPADGTPSPPNPPSH